MVIENPYENGGPIKVTNRAHRGYARHFKKCMPNVIISMGTFKERVIEIKVN